MMRILFEEWLTTQSIPLQGLNAFKEAIICYKASAYRSALLFSYLGFQIIIRDRILRSHSPKDFPTSAWESVQSDLRKDDKWDAQVFDAIHMKRNNKEIFVIGDDLRRQITYWRDRRNDCAHFKSNEITSSHVEAYWTFLQCNLSKVVVNGSKQALLDKVRKHFDIRLTKPNNNFEDIIRDIPYAVNEVEFLDFIGEVHTILCDLENDAYFYDEGPSTEIWKEMFSINSETFKNCLVDYLKSQSELIVSLFQHYPALMNYFSGDPSFIRNLWYEKIYDFWLNDSFKIFVSLLRNNLIPNDQIEESINRCLEKNSTWPERLDEIDRISLEGNSFFNYVKEFVFEKHSINDFEWANKHTKIIVFSLAFCEIDKSIVNRVISTFSSVSNPYKLRDILRIFFAQNDRVREQFKSIAQEHDLLPLPSILGFAAE